MNYSSEYKALQERFHTERPDYGISGARYAAQIENLATKLQTRDILDYGCGKATLQKSLPFPIQNYDPFVPEYSKRPHPARLVVCTDVMEHIEPGFIRQTFHDIHTHCTQAAFFQIATSAASKFLPDGRNAHLTQEGVNFWLTQMLPFFEIVSLQKLDHGFICICTPLAQPIREV